MLCKESSRAETGTMCLFFFTQCSKRDVAFGLDQNKSSLRLKSVILCKKSEILFFNTLRSSFKEEICINGLTTKGNAW